FPCPAVLLPEKLAEKKRPEKSGLFFATFHSRMREGALLSNVVLHPVPLLGSLGVVEAVQGAHQVTGDPANPFKGHVILMASAAGALVPDDAGEAAHRVPVHRVVLRAVADALLLHAADHP